MNAGDYFYTVDDMGILVMRVRMMTNDFQLLDRSRIWIDAILEEFKSVESINTPHIEEKVAEVVGFKMICPD